MHRLHVLLVAALLAGAAGFGTYAALRTTSLGTAHRASADAVVRDRTRQLNRFEAALQRQLARRTPALPKLPVVHPAAPAPAPAAAPRVVYRRPPAIVVVRHTHHGDDGGGETEGGVDD